MQYKLNLYIINNNILYSLTGINIIELKSGLLNNNIILNNNYEGVLIKNSSAIIKNNYIAKNENGIIPEWDSNPKIEFNRIVNNRKWGIIVKSGSKPTIENNDICYNTSAIYIPATGYLHNAQPRINNNNILINFTKNRWLVKILGSSSNPNIYDIDAKNNFWGTAEEDLIKSYIYDKNDIINKDYTGEIIYTPYKYDKISNVGIK